MNLIAGSLVSWATRDRTPISVCQALKDAGYAACVPGRRDPVSILKDAIQDVFGTRGVLIRSLKGGRGFQVTKEAKNDGFNDYVGVYTISVNPGELPTLNVLHGGARPDLQNKIVDSYRKCEGLLTASAVGLILTRAARDVCFGIAARPQGGSYWIPSTHVHHMKRIGEIVSNANGGELRFFNHSWDDDSVKAVAAALHDEVSGQISSVMEEIKNPDRGLRSAKTQEKEIKKTMALVERYQEFLNVDLKPLADQVEKAQRVVAVAVLKRAND